MNTTRELRQTYTEVQKTVDKLTTELNRYIGMVDRYIGTSDFDIVLQELEYLPDYIETVFRNSIYEARELVDYINLHPQNDTDWSEVEPLVVAMEQALFASYYDLIDEAEDLYETSERIGTGPLLLSDI